MQLSPVPPEERRKLRAALAAEGLPGPRYGAGGHVGRGCAGVQLRRLGQAPEPRRLGVRQHSREPIHQPGLHVPRAAGQFGAGEHERPAVRPAGGEVPGPR